jgi:transposase
MDERGLAKSSMQDDKKLPDDLGTAHEVILVQSDTLVKLKVKNNELNKSLQEALAEIRFLRSGKKREKFINADQLLLEFPEDKELQASLEAAKKEAEEAIVEITYIRKKAAKPRKFAQDTFPAHLPRETVEVEIPEEFKKRIKSGEMIVIRESIRESLKFIPPKLVVVEYREPVLAFSNTPDQEIPVQGEANLGDKGRYHPSVAAQIVNGKFGFHLPYYRLQDLFASSGWTPSRSSLDYLTDLVHETTQDLPKLMLSQIKKGRCLGLDDTQVKLIMPKDLPDKAEGIEDPQIKRLIEKMIEAKKEKKDSLDTKLGGAFNYIRNHWEALSAFVNDGALPIDNNQVERLMKRIAVGRKNWLFIGSLRAGIRNASLMSLVASALRQDLDVAMYLESVITHMLRGTAKTEELLPDRWKAAHPEAVREYREQERRDKADTAVLQAARRRVRAELRKGK